MKPEADTPAPTPTTPPTTTAPTPDAAADKKPSGRRGPYPFEPMSEAEQAEAAARQADEMGKLLDAIAPKVRAAFTDRVRLRVEAATRIACALMRNRGGTESNIAGDAVALADRIIAEVDRST